MAGLLGQVFSAGNVARRKLTDLLGNPVLSAQQIVGNLNDRARVLNEMTSAAAQEGVNYGPASRQLAGLLAEAYSPVGMVAPRSEALKIAQKNAAKPISEGGLGLPPDNTPMDRARAMGFDTPIYHATSADFGEFVPSSLRGASYFASSPERAMRGAKAGAADRLGAGQPDRVMPLMTRSQEVEGLTISKPQREWFNSLPEEATESQVESLMNKAPKDGYWFMWYDEIQLPSGEFKYIKKQEPFVSYEQAVKTNKDIYGRGFSDYSDSSSERFASEMAKNQGRGAYLQNDESGLAMAVVDPSIVRSRFAAFDPARRNEADILAGVLPLSLLADEEQRKKADAYFRSLLGQ